MTIEKTFHEMSSFNDRSPFGISRLVDFINKFLILKLLIIGAIFYVSHSSAFFFNEIARASLRRWDLNP